MRYIVHAAASCWETSRELRCCAPPRGENSLGDAPKATIGYDPGLPWRGLLVRPTAAHEAVHRPPTVHDAAHRPADPDSHVRRREDAELSALCAVLM